MVRFIIRNRNGKIKELTCRFGSGNGNGNGSGSGNGSGGSDECNCRKYIEKIQTPTRFHNPNGFSAPNAETYVMRMTVKNHGFHYKTVTHIL